LTSPADSAEEGREGRGTIKQAEGQQVGIRAGKKDTTRGREREIEIERARQRDREIETER
jgi:hypothetical protein